jgi:hypothetical protein
LEERVLRLEAGVHALQGSHQTAAAQAGLESDAIALKGWAGPRPGSAIVPALPPIFAPPAAATTAAPPTRPLRPAGLLDSQDRIGASVVMCSIHQQTEIRSR